MESVSQLTPSTLAGLPAASPKMAEQFTEPVGSKEPKVVIKGQDMPDEMKRAALEAAVNVSRPPVRARIALCVSGRA